MKKSQKPLAERLRPEKFEDIIGQPHLAGKEGVINRAVNNGRIPSMILWGPPGVGKTTLAQVIAKESGRPFYNLSAINSGVKEVREVIAKASETNLLSGQNPILFIDEIHRFSKSQQDALLGAVEKGVITLIGATTENPSFEVIPALLSRCQVFTLKELGKEDLLALLHKALKNDPYVKKSEAVLKEHNAILRLSGGDARKLLNILEMVLDFLDESNREITDDFVEAIIKENIVRYDKAGEIHYDVISAFIKSLRGSDPNAAVYWLARMIDAGEDPLFIARRMLILASEDIGNADPNALLLANTCFQAVHQTGYPECELILAQTAIYLAGAKKSNSAYKAIKAAKAKVRETGPLPVPLHLRNAPTKLMKDIGYGKDYRYSHDYKGNFVGQEYLPEAISGSNFYIPGDNPRENKLRDYLRNLWKDKYDF